VDILDQHAGLRRSIALLLVATVTSACATWQRVPGPGSLNVEQPHEVRVSLLHGGQLVIYSPTVSGNELVGLRHDGDEASRLAIPLADVRFVEVQKVDARRTGVAVGSVVVTLAILIVAAFADLHLP
jgi:hypothetical protein